MKMKVQAVMTAPRYEATWCRNQIEFSLRALGIPLTVSGGVYYGQCMQMMLEQAVRDGVEYAVTVDGDTVFKPEQLHRLLSIVAQEDLDCLAALQLRRGKKTMLGTRQGQTSLEWDGYPLQVDTAHFGLTVINLQKLSTVAKPWFFCQPDENGEWTDSKIDSDVWFWCQWKKAGLKCWIDPGTRIGHVEEMVVMYDENMQPIHVYPNEWVKLDADRTCADVEAVSSREAVGT